MDSLTAVDALLRVDPGFEELCKTLLGDVVDPVDVWQYLYGTDPVVKMSDPSEVHVRRGVGEQGRRPRRARRVVYASAREDGIGVNPPREGSSNQYGYSVGKSDGALDVTWSCRFSKTDDEKRQVFGWASVVALDGRPVVDRQGDLITPEEIEKAAYAYVVDSRKGGHQHRRTDDGQPFHASDMIESIVFTPEKIAKMGLPDDFPVGWWVGYKVRDEDTWERIKSGDVTGFSIHGKGRRAPVGA